MRLVGLILVVLLGMGCATAAKTDKVSFDRGSFALSYASFVAPMLSRCAASKAAPTPECAQLTLLDQQVRQAIIDAPKMAANDPMSGLDLNSLLPIIMKLAPLAAGL